MLATLTKHSQHMCIFELYYTHTHSQLLGLWIINETKVIDWMSAKINWTEPRAGGQKKNTQRKINNKTISQPTTIKLMTGWCFLFLSRYLAALWILFVEPILFVTSLNSQPKSTKKCCFNSIQNKKINSFFVFVWILSSYISFTKKNSFLHKFHEMIFFW